MGVSVHRGLHDLGFAECAIDIFYAISCSFYNHILPMLQHRHIPTCNIRMIHPFLTVYLHLPVYIHHHLNLLVILLKLQIESDPCRLRLWDEVRGVEVNRRGELLWILRLGLYRPASHVQVIGLPAVGDVNFLGHGSVEASIVLCDSVDYWEALDDCTEDNVRAV